MPLVILFTEYSCRLVSLFTTDSMAVGTHRGLLSVKLVTHGAERYRIGRREVELRPGRVLVERPRD